MLWERQVKKSLERKEEKSEAYIVRLMTTTLGLAH